MGKAKEEVLEHAIERLFEDAQRSRERFTEKANAFEAATKLVLLTVKVKTWVTLALGYAALALVMCLLVAGIVWSLRWILQGLGIV